MNTAGEGSQALHKLDLEHHTREAAKKPDL